jgi:Aminoacyl-tRNA editing domain
VAGRDPRRFSNRRPRREHHRRKIDSVGAALIGGLIAGAIIGAAQWLALGPLNPGHWLVATSVGMAAGLTAEAALVRLRHQPRRPGADGRRHRPRRRRAAGGPACPTRLRRALVGARESAGLGTALGLAATDVAKTLVVKTPGGYVRAVLPASERLDLRKLREFLGVGTHGVHLATEDDLRRDFPEFELGAAPPVGGGRPDPVVIDRRLVGRESLLRPPPPRSRCARVAGARTRRLRRRAAASDHLLAGLNRLSLGMIAELESVFESLQKVTEHDDVRGGT